MQTAAPVPQYPVQVATLSAFTSSNHHDQLQNHLRAAPEDYTVQLSTATPSSFSTSVAPSSTTFIAGTATPSLYPSRFEQDQQPSHVSQGPLEDHLYHPLFGTETRPWDRGNNNQRGDTVPASGTLVGGGGGPILLTGVEAGTTAVQEMYPSVITSINTAPTTDALPNVSTTSSSSILSSSSSYITPSSTASSSSLSSLSSSFRNPELSPDNTSDNPSCAAVRVLLDLPMMPPPPLQDMYTGKIVTPETWPEHKAQQEALAQAKKTSSTISAASTATAATTTNIVFVEEEIVNGGSSTASRRSSSATRSSKRGKSPTGTTPTTTRGVNQRSITTTANTLSSSSSSSSSPTSVRQSQSASTSTPALSSSYFGLPTPVVGPTMPSNDPPSTGDVSRHDSHSQSQLQSYPPLQQPQQGRAHRTLMTSIPTPTSATTTAPHHPLPHHYSAPHNSTTPSTATTAAITTASAPYTSAAQYSPYYQTARAVVLEQDHALKTASASQQHQQQQQYQGQGQGVMMGVPGSLPPPPLIGDSFNKATTATRGVVGGGGGGGGGPGITPVVKPERPRLLIEQPVSFASPQTTQSQIQLPPLLPNSASGSSRPQSASGSSTHHWSPSVGGGGGGSTVPQVLTMKMGGSRSHQRQHSKDDTGHADPRAMTPLSHQPPLSAVSSSSGGGVRTSLHQVDTVSGMNVGAGADPGVSSNDGGQHQRVMQTPSTTSTETTLYQPQPQHPPQQISHQQQQQQNDWESGTQFSTSQTLTSPESPVQPAHHNHSQSQQPPQSYGQHATHGRGRQQVPPSPLVLSSPSQQYHNPSGWVPPQHQSHQEGVGVVPTSATTAITERQATHYPHPSNVTLSANVNIALNLGTATAATHSSASGSGGSGGGGGGGSSALVGNLSPSSAYHHGSGHGHVQGVPTHHAASATVGSYSNPNAPYRHQLGNYGHASSGNLNHPSHPHVASWQQSQAFPSSSSLPPDAQLPVHATLPTIGRPPQHTQQQQPYYSLPPRQSSSSSSSLQQSGLQPQAQQQGQYHHYGVVAQQRIAQTEAPYSATKFYPPNHQPPAQIPHSSMSVIGGSGVGSYPSHASGTYGQSHHAQGYPQQAQSSHQGYFHQQQHSHSPHQGTPYDSQDSIPAPTSMLYNPQQYQPYPQTAHLPPMPMTGSSSSSSHGFAYDRRYSQPQPLYGYGSPAGGAAPPPAHHPAPQSQVHRPHAPPLYTHSSSNTASSTSLKRAASPFGDELSSMTTTSSSTYDGVGIGSAGKRRRYPPATSMMLTATPAVAPQGVYGFGVPVSGGGNVPDPHAEARARLLSWQQQAAAASAGVTGGVVGTGSGGMYGYRGAQIVRLPAGPSGGGLGGSVMLGDKVVQSPASIPSQTVSQTQTPALGEARPPSGSGGSNFGLGVVNFEASGGQLHSQPYHPQSQLQMQHQQPLKVMNVEERRSARLKASDRLEPGAKKKGDEEDSGAGQDLSSKKEEEEEYEDEEEEEEEESDDDYVEGAEDRVVFTRRTSSRKRGGRGGGGGGRRGGAMRRRGAGVGAGAGVSRRTRSMSHQA